MDEHVELQEIIENQEDVISMKYIINHLVSANKLKVYIRIELFEKEAEVCFEEVMQYLEEQGIVYGIRENEIKEYCKNKEYSKELIAACGKEPENGIDAKLIYDFDISKEFKFEEKEDGSIDFHNLNNIINVKKDDVLCHIIPAQDGIEGIDVYGKTINYKKGRNVSFNNGNNTYISLDGLKLLASTDGSVEFSNDRVYVESVYRVNNVDNGTGNIDFIGNVVVNGDVKAGFSVTSKGDIKIRGMVEGAYIKAGGDVVISKGMNGMGKGTIYAKGNITSKYIENASIVSDESVYAEALINSDVSAKESIILRGSNAAIIGGTCQAEQTIYAKTIGNKTNTETNVILNLTEYQQQQKEYALKRKLNQQLEKELINKNKEIKEIDEKNEIIVNSGMDINNKNAVKKQLIVMKIKVNNEIEEIKRQLEDTVPIDNIANHKIICKGIMYSNTRIAIGWMKYKVRQDISYSKIYNDGNDISIVPLNPSDIE
ncbi:MAG: FapA family protein [Sedimentibacter sp.]|uniref:DUF342 domain-containing protein n=1 Tax=Sedimentibacter sp. TaxID=1960295 RepID=UPI002982A9F0|nr:FapA family protein [Sedimentibacter sp.]MDW5300020.1 FapA family protein [Sedimentibacter sp.]